jgi:ketosteroid isomerase-like protein
LLVIATVLSVGTVASASAGEPANRDTARDVAGESATLGWSEGLTYRRTQDYLHAVEREDLAAVADLQSPQVTLTHPITFSGNQQPDAVFVGSEQVLGYLRGLFGLMSRIHFTDVRVGVVAGGRQSFVETLGDFVTADGRPYRNVYVLRFDWGADGRIVRAAEYYNPITFCQTFPTSPTCAG